MNLIKWERCGDGRDSKVTAIPEGRIYLIDNIPIFVPSRDYLASSFAAGMIAAQKDWLAYERQESEPEDD